MSGGCGRLTDTHCHLNHSDFDPDCEGAIERARQAGVERIIVAGFDLPSSRRALQLACDYQGVQAALGIQPGAAQEWTDSARDELIAMAHADVANVVAWGEVGLDYYWDSIPRDIQHRVFSDQISIAVSLDLPLVVHGRDAYNDVLDVLSCYPAARGVLHCFTGTLSEARRAVDGGFYLGVGGIATYKKNDALRDIIRQLPIDRILLETDSPYLAPQARRGKRNEPAYTALIAEAIAPVVGLDIDELARVTTENANRLFGPV